MYPFPDVQSQVSAADLHYLERQTEVSAESLLTGFSLSTTSQYSPSQSCCSHRGKESRHILEKISPAESQCVQKAVVVRCERG